MNGEPRSLELQDGDALLAQYRARTLEYEGVPSLSVDLEKEDLPRKHGRQPVSTWQSDQSAVAMQ